jgi:hypothetical protein
MKTPPYRALAGKACASFFFSTINIRLIGSIMPAFFRRNGQLVVYLPRVHQRGVTSALPVFSSIVPSHAHFFTRIRTAEEGKKLQT